MVLPLNGKYGPTRSTGINENGGTRPPGIPQQHSQTSVADYRRGPKDSQSHAPTYSRTSHAITVVSIVASKGWRGIAPRRLRSNVQPACSLFRRALGLLFRHTHCLGLRINLIRILRRHVKQELPAPSLII